MPQNNANAAHEVLAWVKPELDLLLDHARQSLESYVEDQGRKDLLNSIRHELRQVRGTLQIVDLTGAVMFAEEMEALIEELIEDRVENRDAALGVLSAAVLQLPDYLEYIQSGHADAPIVILPILNDMRAARNAPLLSENLVFVPDVAPDVSASEAGQPADTAALKSERLRFQRTLLKVLRDKARAEDLRHMSEALEAFEAASRQTALKRLWHVSAALPETLSPERAAPEAVKHLLSRIDRLLREVMQHGERQAAKSLPADLLGNLLYYIGRSEKDGPRVQAVRQEYDLQALLPTPEDIEEARRQLAAPNARLLETVGAAIHDELSEIRDQIEVYTHTHGAQAIDFDALGERLRRLGDTFGMLGLGEGKEQLSAQAVRLESLLRTGSPIDDGDLLSLAEIMLQIEQSVRVMLEHRREGAAHGRITDEMTAAGVREALRELNRVKEGLLAFFADPDDRAAVSKAPKVLTDITAALSLIGVQAPAQRLEKIGHWIRSVLQSQGAPDHTAQETLAEALTAVEMYLESRTDRHIEQPGFLERADALLARLAPAGHVAGPSSEAGSESAETALIEAPELAHLLEGYDASPASESEAGPQASEPASDAGDEPSSIEVEQTRIFPPEAGIEAAASTPEASGAGGDEPQLQAIREDADPEILEIFLEEAQEEVERIAELLPKWEANRDDLESLTSIRRSFHTLKGSGRLAGAELMGEFAWSFENLLNRLLDHSIELREEHVSLLHQALDTLRQLVRQLEGTGEPTHNPQALMRMAEAAASGLPASAPSPAEAEAPPTEAKEQAIAAEARPVEVEARPAEAGAPAPEVEAQVYEAEARSTGSAEVEAPPTESQEPVAEAQAQPAEAEAQAIEAEARSAEVDAPPAEAHEQAAKAQERPAEIAAEAGEAKGSVSEPVLTKPLQDFIRQARAHLAVIDESLTSTAGGAVALPVDASVVSAWHALHESARAVDLPAFVSLFAPLERITAYLHERQRPVPQGLLGLLQEAILATETALQAPPSVAGGMPELSELVQRLDAAWDELMTPADAAAHPDETAAHLSPVELLPAPEADQGEAIRHESPAQMTPSPTEAADEQAEAVDEELVSIFVDEASDLMDSADAAIQAWENGDDAAFSSIETLQRDLHTLKGSARMAGYTAIGDLTHALESFVGRIAERGGQAVPEEFALLHRAMDRLGDLLQVARALRPVPRQTDLIDALNAWKRPSADAAPAEPAATGQAIEEAPEHRPQTASGHHEASAAPMPAANAVEAGETPGVEEEKAHPPMPASPEPVGHAAPAASVRKHEAAPIAEQIRVRAELLDTLVNQAGEVNIYHARLQQQISGFGFNLAELDQTIGRLRSQLRKLELETEAQILYRFHNAQEASMSQAQDAQPEFDPLELDRYSNIQQLSRALAESLNDLSSIEDLLAEQVRESEMLLQQQQRVSTELQEGLMRSRMVQFAGLAPRLRRIVRQTAAEMGKKVQLQLSGEQSEIDRSVLDRLIAPLEHMLRNAIAHGIESPEQRSAAGKAEMGVITLRVAREGSEVVIVVEDDGRGIDVQAVRAKALERGLIRAEDRLTDEQLLPLILESGLSTADSVSQIAGRGVGLDVVSSEIKQLGGVLGIDSRPGRGTRFTIRLPFTLTISQALLVQAGRYLFAIPLNGLEGVVRIKAAELRQLAAEASPRYAYLGAAYDLRSLEGVFDGSSGPLPAQEESHVPLLLIRSGEQRVALSVDAVIGSREVVVKSLGPQFARMQGIAGATILGDGRVVLILDPPGLARKAAAAPASLPAPAVAGIEPHAHGPLIMVVDDSITIRKVTSRVLERHGFEVVTARDGMDAVALLEERRPDLVLTDIEMPRMDGYELSSHVRNDPRFSDIPIIMITSRSGEKHRARAKQLGVDRYLGKPYQEDELLDAIRSAMTQTV